jgi:glyoxylase-like metal-dependent hydrolase (beta-lactamase superfamily II)
VAIEIVPIDTPSLGDRSYLATDGEVAVVVDPQRDIDRVLALAAARRVAITHVLETHVHNDYLTGGLALAARAGAAYHVNGADQVAFDRVPTGDGDVITAGAMRLRVIATPGHTFTHLSYVLSDAGSGQALAVFTGGSLLHGTTGRPDLLGAEHVPALARAQHASAALLAAVLPDATAVCPTHGFGSFCAAGPAATTTAGSTIGTERRRNPALTLDPASYISGLLAGLDAYPAYYAQMAPANAAGPQPPDLSPPASVTASEIGESIGAGRWVVDLRQRRAFAAAHVPGSVSFEFGPVSSGTSAGSCRGMPR